MQAHLSHGKITRFVSEKLYTSASHRHVVNMKLIKAERCKDFVMLLKSNRVVAFPERDRRAGRYQAVEVLPLEHGQARVVWLGQVGFPLLLVKQVFTNKDDSQGLPYLVTSDTASWMRPTARPRRGRASA